MVCLQLLLQQAWLTALNTLKGDLFLAGHTHNGQIFPWHPLIYHWFSHPNGLLSVPASIVQQGNGGFNSFDRHLYVNPGTGSWGTPARTSGFGEITIITVSPE
ncbi:MAG: hypothetical protein EZS28_044078 [Streblomastix strix]|uniref:Calcineurin-like phosphoesterase domain-containing protein n=1 Tax=Streblomastix strix TaxID=222440 RepID=A0A5J4TPL3_9EUKA|nr:MAG: hypothetical protein EZS28_044078 [Streblomastix strix]